MSAAGEKGDAAKTHMAEASGTDLAGYNAQLSATQMFYTPQPAVDFVRSDALGETMASVAAFSFEHGLLGEERRTPASSASPCRRRDRRFRRQRPAALRRQLHADGGRRRTVARNQAAGVNDAVHQSPARAARRHRRGGAVRAGLAGVRLRFQRPLGGEPERQAAARCRKHHRAIERVAFEPDRRSGDYLFWNDTASSLRRLATGVLTAAAIGLGIGVLNGLLPWFGAFWSPWVRALSMIPPLAILPILFIVFGNRRTGQVMLIVLGTAPRF